MLERLRDREPVATAAVAAALVAITTGISTGETLRGIGTALVVAVVGVIVRQLVVSPATAADREGKAMKRGIELATSVHVDPSPKLPEPRGRLRGLIASWPDHRDLGALAYVSATTTFPKVLNLAKGLVLNILGNDRVGDCFWAAILHGMQCAYTAAGQPFSPTLDMAVTGYRTTGYDPTRGDGDDNPTDRGTEPRAGFKAAVKLGWIKAFVSVPIDEASLRKAIVAYRGAVVLCWALPANVPENGDWSKAAGPAADGHATQAYGYTTTRVSNDTWAERGWFTPPFARAYLQAAWAFTLPDPAVQPLIDHDRLAEHVAALHT